MHIGSTYTKSTYSSAQRTSSSPRQPTVRNKERAAFEIDPWIWRFEMSHGWDFARPKHFKDLDRADDTSRSIKVTDVPFHRTNRN